VLPAIEARVCLSVNQSLGLISLLVREYDEAIAFFVGTLGFCLIEDSYIPEQNKRWVVVKPKRSSSACLLLARATTEDQKSRIGNQSGDRVFLFLYTDDFWRDYESFKLNGVAFVRAPEQQPHGIVAVFKDLWGNSWDLIQPNEYNKSWVA
jgi:catechol 2,3-dioxygenase-like lactoylglutathione lyase family enzyme